MERSYCGSSLHVLVHTTKPTASSGSSDDDAFGVGELSVFARFESSSDAGLEPGECLSFDSVTAGTQSEENPEGQWIPGVRERPMAHATSIKTVTQMPSEVRLSVLKCLVMDHHSQSLSLCA